MPRYDYHVDNSHIQTRSSDRVTLAAGQFILYCYTNSRAYMFTTFPLIFTTSKEIH